MDIYLLAALLGLGDIVLVRIWWRERSRRLRAELHANDAIRKNYKLLDAIERKAAAAKLGPVTIPLCARPREIRDAILELKARQASDPGGAA
jgi:hypothetical protein